METQFLTQWISGQMIHAICWTLIHSLWIGLLVAVLAGGVIVGTQKASSQLRYQLLCGCLLLFVGTMGFVFYRETTAYHSPQLATVTVTSVSTIASPTPALVQGSSLEKQTADSPIINQLTTIINQYTGWIFAIWLLFFAFKSLKLISGLYSIHRIRTHKIHTLDNEWQQKVLSFSRALGIQQSIALVQSELVNVPVTVGLLKPMILLPMGLLFQLPAEQIDTILWHELAHIRRRDYLVNLLQSLVETVFFFNPALLWLSSLIREEREICCDDIVLAHTARKSNYLEALLAFQSNSNQPAAYAVAFGFGNHQLMNRLKRMVTQENKRLSVVEKVGLLSGLVLLTASSFISTPMSKVTHRTVASPSHAVARAIQKNTPAPIHGKVNGYPVKAHIPDKGPRIDIPAISISTPSSPKDTARTFTSILFAKTNQDMANRDMQVRDDKGNRYHLKIANNQLVLLEVNGTLIPTQDWDNYKELLPQIDRVLREKSQAKHEAITEAKAKSAEAHQQQLDQLKAGQLAKANRRQQLFDKAVTGSPEKQWPDGITKQKRAINQRDSIASNQVLGSKKVYHISNISHDQARVRGIIATLVQEKIVADSTAVDWFGLSDDELVVNGNRQPEALHRKLKAVYGIQPQNGLYYGPVKMVGTGVFLDKGDL